METYILLVDSKAQAYYELISAIKGSKYKVVATSSYGDKAIETYKKFKPDLVVMDISTPGHLDGSEGGKYIIKRFLEIDTMARVVITYTEANHYLVMGTLREGAVGKIPKPFKREKVLDALATAEIVRQGTEATMRIGSRLYIPLDVRYKRTSANFFKPMRPSITIDISISGVSIRSQEILPERTLLNIIIDIPTDNRVLKFKAQGQVKRCKPIVGLNQYNVGITFTQTDSKQVEALKNYILRGLTTSR